MICVGFPLTILAASPTPEPANPDPPYLTSTVPSDGEVGVRLHALLDIRFSWPMDTLNTLVFIRPSIPLTYIWIDSQRLWLTHEDFTPCMTYRLWADGYDVNGESMAIGQGAPGAANPWSFTTECAAFVITLTDPVDNETDVPVAGVAMGQDVSPILIWFSRPVDPATFRITLTPPIPLTPVWSKGNGSVTVRHDDDWFEDCALHTVTISARDTSGQPLTNITGSKPNPWTFTTLCLGTWIVSTSPANGTTGVDWGAPIVVTFSKRMLRATVNATLAPDPGFPFEPNWTGSDRVLTLTHAAAFPASVTFIVNVSGIDKNGNPLIAGPAPNPWTFSTTPTPSPPAGLQVSRTLPDITLTWRAVAGATSYVVYSSQDRFAPWPWPRLSEPSAPTYLHRGAHEDGATHYYIVRAKQASVMGEVFSENSTMAVKADLRFGYDDQRTNVYWMSLPYRTMYKTASDITGELTSSRIDVVGKWDPHTESSILWFFFRGAWRGTDFPLAPGDGFFLGILESFSWVVNGTDGEVAHPFAMNPPPNSRVDWMSVPYTGAFSRASEVVLEIEGTLGGTNTRIAEIARWDPSLQRFVTFSWSPMGWVGTDFSLVVGEGLRFQVISAFEWTPRLVTSEVP